MSSLYKRATPAQASILRIVEGAVKNATDAHPKLQISPQHRRSIAKRAAGTLTAQWPDVLAAAPAPSDSGGGSHLTRSPRRSSQLLKATGREAPRVSKGFPLRRLIAEIARPIRDLKLSGQTARAEAMIDVLRIIDRLRFPAERSPSDLAAKPTTAAPATDEQKTPPTREEAKP